MSNLTFAHHGEAERWLPVPGWKGRYDVSDLGRVRSPCVCNIINGKNWQEAS